MSPASAVEETPPREPTELPESYQPEGIQTERLLRKIKEEGEDFWLGR